MRNTLKQFQKQYGDITISELIKELDKPKEQGYHYRIHKSLIRSVYIVSDKGGNWDMINCKNIKEAEMKIQELIKEDAKNGIKSIYSKKEGDK